MPITRYAIVKGSDVTTDRVAAYLPNNYGVVAPVGDSDDKLAILIAGYDHAGWTLADYVIPRLASGLMFATELVEATS